MRFHAPVHVLMFVHVLLLVQGVFVHALCGVLGMLGVYDVGQNTVG